jgi:mannosidase alpha-like ER degradation enhancer 1/mannosidase alpha-like ER degradation enhancer 2
MKYLISSIFIILVLIAVSCQSPEQKAAKADKETADQIKAEFVRSWEGYKTYAWGHDVLLPVSKGHMDWYEESLHISPIDAYSTMKVMGLDAEAERVKRYVVDSVDFNKDIFVKTFEVNIRILGGLLAMYEMSGDVQVLNRARDFGDRLMPAFNSPTGIPYYYVNLKTGETKGAEVNLAEGGTYMLEMGLLSRYTGNLAYYMKAKGAMKAIFSRSSRWGLVGERINVETGEWKDVKSHIGCCIDSYFEYMYKGYVLFGDEELKRMWEKSIIPIQSLMADPMGDDLWYGQVNMETGEKMGSTVTLYDAYFPAVLALSGDLERAAKNQAAFNRLWMKNGLEPMVYDYKADKILNASYDLNPEIIESAYYLYYFTKDVKYKDMARQYFADLVAYCRTDIAFTCIEDVTTKKQKDHMETFFLAETMKYLYLVFANPPGINPDKCVFSTEAHPFRKEPLAAVTSK